MEAGRKAVAIYEKLEKVNEAVNKLKGAFPRLLISSVLYKPYTNVTIRAYPIDQKPWIREKETEFDEPLDEFPSDHLVTKLALIS